MKGFVKILFISVAVMLFSSYVFSVNAEESVSFSAENTSTKNNRIFSVSVSGNGDEILSAVKFVFEFDGNAIEFREINVTDKNSKVRAVKENGRLNLIFLNDKGIDLSGGKQLFTVNFKSENMSKNQEIAFTASDCVNSNVKSFNATGGKCSVLYLGNAKDSEENSKNGSSGGDAQSNGSGSENGNSPIYDENGNLISEGYIDGTNNQGEDELKVNERDNTLKIFISSSIIMLALVLLCGVLFYLGRKSKDKEDDVKK